VPGGGTVTFTYDPFGRRIRKVSRTGAVAYIYDGDNIIQEIGRSGNAEVKYTYGPGIDEPLAMQVGRVTSYYEADGLGTITSLSGPGGVLRGTYQYDSFGMPKSSTDRTNSYRYTARQLDPETGLYYYRARYYDPSIGRFLSEDPLGFAAGDTNFYAYAFSSPTNNRDPSGQVVPLIVGGLLLAYAAVEIGLSIYDVYDTVDTLTDPERDTLDKIIAGGGLVVGAFCPGGGYGTIGKKGRQFLKNPVLDRSGKMHGALPRAADLGSYRADDLRHWLQGLRQSVQERIRRTAELGSDKGHALRQAEEQELIRRIETYLEDLP
jgi:RHS repeat-associated protein